MNERQREKERKKTTLAMTHTWAREYESFLSFDGCIARWMAFIGPCAAESRRRLMSL
jgi:hypothetical protein